jgi:hypothetical protein
MVLLLIMLLNLLHGRAYTVHAMYTFCEVHSKLDLEGGRMTNKEGAGGNAETIRHAPFIIVKVWTNFWRKLVYNCTRLSFGVNAGCIHTPQYTLS